MFIKVGKEKFEVDYADTFHKRLIGFMGKKNINSAMLFPRCNSIHTFMMKENIDVVGLDQNNEVIYKYENLPKNQVIKIHNDIKKTSVLELPAHKSKKIRLGSILIFEDKDII